MELRRLELVNLPDEHREALLYEKLCGANPDLSG
jgi:hypothetical protein